MLSRNDLKSLVRLQQKKYRDAEKKLLIEGARLTLEALKSDWQVDELIHTRPFAESQHAKLLFALAAQREIPIVEVTQVDFKKLSDTVTSQGVIAVVAAKDWQTQPLDRLRELPRCLFVAIEKLQDPGNLGTIIRTAEWLGADAMVVGPESVAWSNPKTLRASMGAIFHLPVFEEQNFIDFLSGAKLHGATIYAADQRGDFPYTTLRFSRKNILLLGDEIQGISEACRVLADRNVVIPSRGRGESLNVAIAAAILMAEMTRG